MKSVEIFAGAGGLALGAHRAGFDCSLMLDSSKHVCDTLRHNQVRGIAAISQTEICQADIASFDFDLLRGPTRILLGGPPCQPFSIAGKRTPHSDPRNMFPEAIRALGRIRPDAFVFENVRGLTLGQNRAYADLVRLQLQFPRAAGDYLALDWEAQLAKLQDRTMLECERSEQYSVSVQILNAADFGVAQIRERVFFVGFRNDISAEWHFPLATHSKEALAYEQRPGGHYWDLHEIPNRDRIYSKFDDDQLGHIASKRWQTVRDAFIGIPERGEDSEEFCQISQHQYIPGAKSYRGHTGSPLDLPAKTLKAGVNGVPGGENMLRRPDGTVRYFTIRECARLQTFPDEYEFMGSRSHQIKQLGNAVPCLLAEILLKSVYETLKKSKN